MNKTCCFFGHRYIINDTPVKEKLKRVILKLIQDEHVDTFYVGQQGNFELFAYQIVSEVQKLYPFIRIILVIAYVRELEKCGLHFDEFYYPCERAPRHIAIRVRNDWLAKHSDYAVCFVNTEYGGAYKAMCLAQKSKKKVINLSQ